MQDLFEERQMEAEMEVEGHRSRTPTEESFGRSQDDHA
jgi:hypothetical protein